MPRYNLVATLCNAEVSVSDTGAAQRVLTGEREVFANKYSMGASTWAAARSAGLHADAQIALRSLEYEGEEVCIIDGVEYEVERASDRGEFTTLTLKRRLANG